MKLVLLILAGLATAYMEKIMFAAENTSNDVGTSRTSERNWCVTIDGSAPFTHLQNQTITPNCYELHALVPGQRYELRVSYSSRVSMFS
jgi:hypothetical protein